MKPRIGDFVHFYDTALAHMSGHPTHVGSDGRKLNLNGQHEGPYAALVVQSFDGPYLNLIVFAWGGEWREGSVSEYADTDESNNTQRYWKRIERFECDGA